MSTYGVIGLKTRIKILLTLQKKSVAFYHDFQLKSLNIYSFNFFLISLASAIPHFVSIIPFSLI